MFAMYLTSYSEYYFKVSETDSSGWYRWPKGENHGKYLEFKDFCCHLYICHRNVVITHP